MSKLPSITGADAVRAFRKLGFEVVRTRGSHYIMKRDGHANLLTVPVHGSAPVKRGTLRSLIADAGATVEQFAGLL